MSYAEQAVAFGCGDEQLLGILSQPAAPASMGVVIIVGGPQYRVGSHRQFVLLARALAAAGFAVLRFDYRGMGDSSGTPVDFLHADADIGSAIDTLCARNPTVTRVALWGLCDAAAAALLYCEEVQDSRVAALCLLNPWVRSEASLARTQVKHYYTQRLRERAFWVKLFSGKVAWGALTGLIGSIRLALRGGEPRATAQAPFQTRMARAWRGFGGPILLILSGTDLTAKEFLDYASSDGAWSGALTQPHLSRHDLAAADHTFSAPESSQAVEAITLAWLADIASGQPASA
ncbi:MAG: hypothetical protein RLZ81_2296 [Pseudomonadota bacterium]|jgi:exosortase A-associated hydrolase 1